MTGRSLGETQVLPKVCFGKKGENVHTIRRFSSGAFGSSEGVAIAVKEKLPDAKTKNKP